MDEYREVLLDAIRRKADREAAELAGKFVKAVAEEREAILAGLEFEHWLAEGCRNCRSRPKNANLGLS